MKTSHRIRLAASIVFFWSCFCCTSFGHYVEVINLGTEAYQYYNSAMPRDSYFPVGTTRIETVGVWATAFADDFSINLDRDYQLTVWQGGGEYAQTLEDITKDPVDYSNALFSGVGLGLLFGGLAFIARLVRQVSQTSPQI